MSHSCMSHVTLMHESRHIHVCMKTPPSDIAGATTHCNTQQCTATHCNTLQQHSATHQNRARPRHCRRSNSYTCVTWLIHMCDMTHSHVWHDSFTYVTWLIHTCDVTHPRVWHDSFTCVAWLIHMRDVTHSHVWRDPFTCVTWLIHMCDMTHSHVWHYSFTCVTWLNHLCDMTHSCVCHNLFTRVTSLTYWRYPCDLSYFAKRAWDTASMHKKLVHG